MSQADCCITNRNNCPSFKIAFCLYYYLRLPTSIQRGGSKKRIPSPLWWRGEGKVLLLAQSQGMQIITLNLFSTLEHIIDIILAHMDVTSMQAIRLAGGEQNNQ